MESAPILSVDKYRDDQTRAIQEIGKMRLDLDYEDDSVLPEYNVTERVRQLNKELERQPTPNEERDRAITFKANLVDLVAPAPDYSSDEGDDASKQNKSQLNAETPIALSHSYVENPQCDIEKQLIQLDGEQSPYDQIVERNGNFEMISDNSYVTLEDGLIKQPRLQPSTSKTTNSYRITIATPEENSNPQYGFQYRSPYALSDKQKRDMREETNRKYRYDLRIKRDKAKQDEQRSEDSDSAFKAWMNKKLSEEIKKRKDLQKNVEHEKQNNKAETGENAFNVWLHAKKHQLQYEKQIEHQRSLEFKDSFAVRSQDENSKAFKKWLKSKTRKRREENLRLTEIKKSHKLLARNTHNPISVVAKRNYATFAYVDYYGYRC